MDSFFWQFSEKTVVLVISKLMIKKITTGKIVFTTGLKLHNKIHSNIVLTSSCIHTPYLALTAKYKMPTMFEATMTNVIASTSIPNNSCTG